MTTLHAASATDAGRVRPTNQDLALVTPDLVAVADGMGGHAGGEIASQIAIEALRTAFTKRDGTNGLITAARRANTAVHERAAHDAELRGMGTTLTAAALVDDRAGGRIAIVNIGDSRAYLFEGGRLLRLTEDHSLVEEMVRRGELTAEEAAVHPHRNILTRALGIDPDVEVDTWVLEPGTDARLLLCSDGLTNECSDDEITRLLTEIRDLQQAADALLARALEHGGADNITVVLAELDDDSGGALATRVPVASTRVTLASDRSSDSPASSPRARGTRLVTGRAVAFVIVFAALLFAAAGFTIWFNDASYYVGLDGHNIAIFEGRPGGLLMFHPTLVRRTSLTDDDVLSANLPELRAGMLEGSYDAAKAVVASLGKERAVLGMTPSSATTLPSSTAAAASTTTPKKT